VTTAEYLVSAAILSTVVAGSAGGLSRWQSQVSVEQAAAAFETDVHWARSLALARNERLRLRVLTHEGGQCWIVHSGDHKACSCQADGSVQCTGEAQVLREAHWPAEMPVRVQANVSSFAFDPVHGTASPTGTVKFGDDAGPQLHLIVSILGRVRTCAPQPRAGYRPC
jgi:type IV fimbrial biogenesis protein FimT